MRPNGRGVVCLRRIEKIKWTDSISNEEVLQRIDEKRQLINHLSERQAEWIGHVMRGDRLLIDILEGRIKGKKQIGRPRCKTLDWMMNRSYQNLKEC